MHRDVFFCNVSSGWFLWKLFLGTTHSQTWKGDGKVRHLLLDWAVPFFVRNPPMEDTGIPGTIVEKRPRNSMEKMYEI